MLVKKAKNLVVLLIGDNDKNKNILFQNERAEGLSSIELITNIVLLDGVRVISSYQKNKTIFWFRKRIKIQTTLSLLTAETMKRMVERVEFHAGLINYAEFRSINGLNRNLQNKKFINLKACQRQGLSLNDLLKAVDKFKDSNLIVIGDSILDQYSACEALGMSAEAPVVVVKELEHKNFIGGAALVAANVSALGAKCDFISVIGNDENAKYLINGLKIKNMSQHFIVDETRSTTFKKVHGRKSKTLE